MGFLADSFDTYSAHDWRFFWLKSRRAFACDLLKADMVCPLNFRPCQTLLCRALLALRASRHSSSNQGFDFLGMVVALGMHSFAALVMCSTKECKGSASLSIPSEILSKHTSWNCSQLALEKNQWEGSQLGCISATDGRIEVSMGWWYNGLGDGRVSGSASGDSVLFAVEGDWLDWIYLMTTHVLEGILAVLHKFRSCFHFLNKLLKSYHIAQVSGLVEVDK